MWAGNLLNLHEDYRGRPSTWYVCCFLPSLGAESRWDDRGGNSKSVRNTEVMMECNDCLFEGWNEQTATTHLEVWPDKSEVETHIVRAAHINDKPEGDKMLGDPGNCHHCLCPASHWLNPERSWPAKRGITRFRRRPGSSATENSRFTRRTTALYHSPTSILGCTKAGATTITRHTQSKIYTGRAALITC